MTEYLRLLAGFTSLSSNLCRSHFCWMGPEGMREFRSITTPGPNSLNGKRSTGVHEQASRAESGLAGIPRLPFTVHRSPFTPFLPFTLLSLNEAKKHRQRHQAEPRGDDYGHRDGDGSVAQIAATGGSAQRA